MNELTIPNKKILGVCAWLSYKFDVSTSMIRAIFIITTIFGVGSPILLYIVLAITKSLIE